MTDEFAARTVHILLVEDNPGDALLATETLRSCKVNNRVDVVDDGERALQYLRREGAYAEKQRPDFVLLDLNLPKKSGKEVLAEIRGDDELRTIPIVVLSSSRADEDVRQSYEFGANAYVTKPVDLRQFQRIVQSIDDFWFAVARLPPPG